MARTTASSPGTATSPNAASTPAGGGTEAVEDEAAIAARIPAVLADEEATDDAPGIDPSRPTTARPAAASPTPAARSSTVVKWAIWAVIVLLIALFSRSRLRAGAAGPSVR
jgi:hypothetical protein